MHEVAAMKHQPSHHPSQQPSQQQQQQPHQHQPLHQQQQLHNGNASHFLGALNTRKIGSCLRVQLRKSQTGGFGIKIAERANTIGPHSPIHITAILATGSAYQDGRLNEGDMLLEINGQQLVGLTQFEVTRLLKSFPPNSVVEFVVSRPASKDKTSTTESSVDSGPTTLRKPKVSPRQPPSPLNDQQQLTQAQKPIQLNDSQQVNNNKCDTNNQSLIDLDAPDYDDLSSYDDSKFEKKIDSIINNKRNLDGPGTHHYEIPLNDTKSAGLGLYLKFPTVDRKDLGVWIEKVITGGAAWKDGRLLPDDQILAINDINIVGLSNAIATETLKAGCRGFYPENDSKTIRLTIHRRDPSVINRILQGVSNDEEASSEQPASSKSCDEEDFDRKPERKRFQRDGFGRLSMSEKTHAQLMAKNSETFKKNQKVREERGKQKQMENQMEKMRLSESKSHSSFNDIADDSCWRCRALNLKVYDVSPTLPMEQPNPFGRRNNSFRAAINNSYQKIGFNDSYN